MIKRTREAPVTPGMGSTIPDNCPVLNAFILENPSRLKGIETAAPYGKFCNPIPKASAIARVIVSDCRIFRKHQDQIMQNRT